MSMEYEMVLGFWLCFIKEPWGSGSSISNKSEHIKEHEHKSRGHITINKKQLHIMLLMLWGCIVGIFLLHTSSSGLMSRTALSCSFVPSNTITQFGLQSWFNRDRLAESEEDEWQEGTRGVRRRGVRRRREEMCEAESRRWRWSERGRDIRAEGSLKKRERRRCGSKWGWEKGGVENEMWLTV